MKERYAHRVSGEGGNKKEQSVAYWYVDLNNR